MTKNGDFSYIYLTEKNWNNECWNNDNFCMKAAVNMRIQ